MSGSVIVAAIYWASITSTTSLQPPNHQPVCPGLWQRILNLSPAARMTLTISSWSFPVTPQLTESKSLGPKWCAPPSTVPLTCLSTGAPSSQKPRAWPPPPQGGTRPLLSLPPGVPFTYTFIWLTVSLIRSFLKCHLTWGLLQPSYRTL